MRCTKIVIKLERYVERSLTVSEMNSIEDHLCGCTSCSNELTTIRLFQKQFSSEPSPEIEPHISFEISESIYNKKFDPNHSADTNPLCALIKKSAAYVVIGLLAGLAGFLMSHHLWFSQEPHLTRNIDSVEMMFTMTPFGGNSDGSLFQLYTDYVVSFEERDLE